MCGCVFTRNVKAPGVVPACIAVPVRFALLVPCFHPCRGICGTLADLSSVRIPAQGAILAGAGNGELAIFSHS